MCTGNLCRSPMAEVLLRHELARRGVTGVNVRSSGTWAVGGHGATPDAVGVLQRRGVDLSRHRSQALAREQVEQADLVVVMTSVHEREVLEVAPSARAKIVLMKELAEMRPHLDGVDRAGRLQALLAAARPNRRRSLDLDDPMGLPTSSYERCLNEIEDGTAVLAELLAQ